VVYPELATPRRAVAPGAELSPAAPEDMLYLAVESATIPERTRDGRRWDALGGELPDPFVRISIAERELFLTEVQPNTLTPSFPEQPRGNYRIPKGSELRVELWDDNAMTNHPICVRRLRNVHAEAVSGRVDVRCDSGARLVLVIEPAHAELGPGFHYELRTSSIFVTRVERHSPAGRPGLAPGDELVAIQNKPVESLRAGEAQSLINVHSRSGLNLTVERRSGKVEDLTLKEGPIHVARNG